MFKIKNKKIRKNLIFAGVAVLIAGLILTSIIFGGKKAEINSEIIGLELVAENFVSPIKLVEYNEKLFVADRIGVVKNIENNETFLDIRDRMVELMGNYDERGLLGIAFSEENKFYVYYSAPLRESAPDDFDHTSRISEFVIGENGKIDLDSERIILEIDEPQFNHNGGEIIFGSDGQLYVAVGDGGNANDDGIGHSSIGNAQNKSSLLGKILRINVNDENAKPEIYAYGFRNPFRMSFDSVTGKLFVGDVGQNLWEEVDIVEQGKNYGWRIREGKHCFDLENPDESPAECSGVGYENEELVSPILEYNHSVGLSLIGGFVYRGDEIPELYGKYIFGDWSDDFVLAGGKMFIAEEKNNVWNITELVELNSFLLGFGEDNKKELYILTSESIGPVGNSGKVYKIIKNN